MAAVLGYLLATVMLVASVCFFAWLFKSVFKSFFGKGYWVVIAAMLVCSWCNILDSKILSIIAGIAIGWGIKSIFFKPDKTCEDSSSRSGDYDGYMPNDPYTCEQDQKLNYNSEMRDKLDLDKSSEAFTHWNSPTEGINWDLVDEENKNLDTRDIIPNDDDYK